MKPTLRRLSAFLLIAFVALTTACALNLDVSSDSGSITKCIAAGDKTVYSGTTLLGEGTALDSWKTSGSDEKAVQSRVSWRGNAHEISLIGTGPMTASVNTLATSDAVISNLNDLMGGSMGLLKLASESKGNDQYLTAGFFGDVSEGKDGIDASLSMVAKDRSSIGGSLDILGVDGLGSGLEENMAMVLEGLYGNLREQTLEGSAWPPQTWRRSL